MIKLSRTIKNYKKIIKIIENNQKMIKIHKKMFEIIFKI